MKPWLIYAAEKEGDDLVRSLPGWSSCRVGVGKTHAAMGVTRLLLGSDPRPSHIIAFGLAGVHPCGSLSIGDLCVVDRDRLADDGVEDEAGFHDLAELGLGSNGPFLADRELCDKVARALGIPQVAGETVSTCTASDARLAARPRWGAVETMEGAAIAAVCEAFGVRWTQLRCISNRTGDRARSGWDLEGSLQRLHAAVRRLASSW
jgi:futalosine hydrolase